VSHSGLVIYIKKYHLKAKTLHGNSKYFTLQKYNLQKILFEKKPKSFKIL
jgi:hypothetical protein